MKNLLVLLFTLISMSTFSQQDILFSQYMFNKMAINPGYSGSRELLSADLIYRYQWVNIDGAPKTISASLHSPLSNPHLALGVNLYQDRIGPINSTGVMTTFAYRIILPKGKLSFGLQAGIKNNNILWNKINAHDIDDSFLTYQIEKKTIPDANFGIYYYSNKFYVGVSSKQLLQNQTLIVNDSLGNSQFTKLSNHLYFMSGVAIPIGENFVLRPSILGKYVKNAPPQIDLNVSVLMYNTLWLGVSYRTENVVSLIAEINLNQNLRIGYSYDMWFNELKIYNKGSHEMRLSYDFNIGKRLLSPRYF